MSKKYAIRFKGGESWECKTLTEAEEYKAANDGAEVFSGRAAEIVIADGLRKQLARYGVKPGAEVRTILTHVSRSGMSRRIKVVTAYKGDSGPQIMDITRMVAKLCGYKLSQADGALVSCHQLDAARHARPRHMRENGAHFGARLYAILGKLFSHPVCYDNFSRLSTKYFRAFIALGIFFGFRKRAAFPCFAIFEANCVFLGHCSIPSVMLSIAKAVPLHAQRHDNLG